MTIAILCPIEVEYNAVRQLVKDKKEETRENNIYEVGYYSGTQGSFPVILRQAKVTNLMFALEVDRIIRHFNPNLIFLVGIAGGIKDVSIGDIVVVSKVYAYELGKQTKSGFESRPETFMLNPVLIDKARAVKRTLEESKTETLLPYQIFFGAIASGDKVITSSESSTIQMIKRHYSDTLAIEMEAVGFAHILANYPDVSGMIIRGISDLLDNKSQADSAGSQHLASKNAAHFAFQVIMNLNPNQYTNNMKKNNREKKKDSVLSPVLLPQINSDEDTINSSTNEAPPLKQNLQNLKTKIAKNRIPEAIEQLLNLTSQSSSSFHNQMTIQANKWEDLKLKKRIGLISNDDAARESAQITFTLLNIIDDIDKIDET